MKLSNPSPNYRPIAGSTSMPSQQHTGAPGMMIPGTYQAEKYRAKLILPGRSPLTASVVDKLAALA
ncbi:hypothetical protein [Paenibacillus sp. FSL H8-0259]|uniref:hypothetical protein n=1 Tax=Paenibacillus sp. FSL H8-0259 TaxID=1920423 RepID=UPI0015C3209C|nr:hypothetical protein [Paenibacillus sp. FSL H8-0259]